MTDPSFAHGRCTNCGQPSRCLLQCGVDRIKSVEGAAVLVAEAQLHINARLAR